jgi:hypothetical protein
MIEVTDRPVIECFAKNKVYVPCELSEAYHELELRASRPGAALDFAELAAMAASLDAEAADMGIFRIMTPKDGDKRVVWCRKVIEEIKAAKKMFMDLVTSGMVPYRVGVDGKASANVMDEFDPLAEEVIFMPVQAIRGG